MMIIYDLPWPLLVIAYAVVLLFLLPFDLLSIYAFGKHYGSIMNYGFGMFLGFCVPDLISWYREKIEK